MKCLWLLLLTFDDGFNLCSNIVNFFQISLALNHTMQTTSISEMNNPLFLYNTLQYYYYNNHHHISHIISLFKLPEPLVRDTLDALYVCIILSSRQKNTKTFSYTPPSMYSACWMKFEMQKPIYIPFKISAC